MKYKVYVYAICKNESKFVKRWVNSMKEADGIYVLDTGSSDNTVNLLKQNNVIVNKERINPWRFDVARNKSLSFVPKDANICVCTDLDEVFLPGWRKELENNWQKKTTKASYNYNWSLDEKNNPIISFYIEKIHSRKGYIWTHPVHEVLTCLKNKNEHKVFINNITLNHYPDSNKSRSSYLSLLELSVKEDPEDDRNMHYLGREYMYYGKWNDCIDTLIKHLNLPRSTWKDERCASMRFIARSYINLERFEEAKMWLEKAIKEAPYLRDPYMEKALLEFRLQNYVGVKKLCLKSLKIIRNEKTYINETFSNDLTIYDLLSIAYYNLTNYKLAYKYINKALKISSKDERLLSNKKLIKNKKNAT